MEKIIALDNFQYYAVGIDLGTTNTCVSVWTRNSKTVKIVNADEDDTSSEHCSNVSSGYYGGGYGGGYDGGYGGGYGGSGSGGSSSCSSSTSGGGGGCSSSNVRSDGGGSNLLLSAVAFPTSEKGKIRTLEDSVVGSKALNYDPLNTVVEIKRLLGRRYSSREVQDCKNLKSGFGTAILGGTRDRILVDVGGGLLRSPEEITSKILLKALRSADEEAASKVTKAVVTVPAHYGMLQKMAVLDAAKIAGVDIQLLTEPTAAAIAYGYDLEKKRDGGIGGKKPAGVRLGRRYSVLYIS
jgi:molecular chaperone DnaK (HSP70)